MDIYDVLTMIGQPRQRGDGDQQIRCPFHHEGREAHPSARIYRDGNGGHIFCFACGERWNGPALLSRAQGISYTEAIKQLGWNSTVLVDQHEDVEQRLLTALRSVRFLPLDQRGKALCELDSALILLTRNAPRWEIGKEVEVWVARWHPHFA